MDWKFVRYWLLPIPLFLYAGCSTYYETVPTNHIIMVNTEGHSVDPTGNILCKEATAWPCNGKHNTLFEYRALNNFQYHRYVEALLDNIQNGKTCGTSFDGARSYLEKMENIRRPPKLFVFIHGGLNRQTETIERAAKLCERIADAGYYPLFLNWQSAFSTSYLNHLFWIRQGEDWREGMLSTAGGILTAPAQLFGDAARAIMRGAVVTFFQIRNDAETVPLFRPMLSPGSSDLALAQETAYTALCQQLPSGQPPTSIDALEEYARILNRRDEDCITHGIEANHELAQFQLTLGVDKRGALEKNLAFTKYIFTLPTKLVTASTIDAAGTNAWSIMLRSVSQLFHYDAEQRIHNNLEHTHSIKPASQSYTSHGALPFFFKKLEAKLCNKPPEEKGCDNPNKWEITLAAHSTGAIIAHHILREFEDLPIKNILYMGAASSIRDYQETVFPYLTKRNKNLASDQCNQGQELLAVQIPTCVYHLMLHEAAESGEWISDVIDPLPRGSLLIWLDNFLSHPLSKEDRTLGRFTNFITTMHHTPLELRPFIHIRKFGVGEEVHEPKKHGDFSQKFKFWESKCWDKEFDVTKCYKNHGHY
jgi:hypothetical protein